jgi:hypothetical protein
MVLLVLWVWAQESAKTNAVKTDPRLYLRRAEAACIIENFTQAIADYKAAGLTPTACAAPLRLAVC